MKINTPINSVIKTKDGTAKLEWASDFQPKWEGRYARAQSFVDSEVLRLSEPYTPFQQGMLRNSGIFGTVIGSGEVVWNSPYARYLYYGKVMVGRAPKKVIDKSLQFHGAPMRGAFWFERMKRDKGQSILNKAAIIAGGGL